MLGLARRDELFLLAVVPALLVYALLLPRARLSTDVALVADGLTPSEALLARGQRDCRQWSRELRSIAHPEDGYRVAAMPEETLWRIAEAAAAEPTAQRDLRAATR